MIYRANEAQSFEIPGGTSGRLYPPSEDGSHSVAYVKMDGVYPEKGYSLNDRCSESIYLISGQLTLTANGTECVLRPGDLFVVTPGTKYSIKGRGEALDLITPVWDKSQNHIIQN